MGYDAGFDLYPPIDENNTEDNQRWSKFLKEVVDRYWQDTVFCIYPHENTTMIYFRVGEYPSLPLKGHLFRSFRSRTASFVTSRINRAEEYILSVCGIAKRYFGDRIVFWDEMEEEEGPYHWTEIDESDRGMGKRLDFF